MRRRISAISLLVPLLVAGTAAADEIGWPEAVMRLARERERAETCVALVKKYGDVLEIDRSRRTYDDAKAEIHAVIGGLITALAEGGAPAALPTLEARLTAAVAGGEALCGRAQAVMPRTEGERPFILDLFTEALPALVEAVASLWNAASDRADERERLTRATITTQLEATRWPAYATIEPYS